MLKFRKPVSQFEVVFNPVENKPRRQFVMISTTFFNYPTPPIRIYPLTLGIFEEETNSPPFQQGIMALLSFENRQ